MTSSLETHQKCSVCTGRQEYRSVFTIFHLSFSTKNSPLSIQQFLSTVSTHFIHHSSFLILSKQTNFSSIFFLMYKIFFPNKILFYKFDPFYNFKSFSIIRKMSDLHYDTTIYYTKELLRFLFLVHSHILEIFYKEFRDSHLCYLFYGVYVTIYNISS